MDIASIMPPGQSFYLSCRPLMSTALARSLGPLLGQGTRDSPGSVGMNWSSYDFLCIRMGPYIIQWRSPISKRFRSSDVQCPRPLGDSPWTWGWSQVYPTLGLKKRHEKENKVMDGLWTTRSEASSIWSPFSGYVSQTAKPKFSLAGQGLLPRRRILVTSTFGRTGWSSGRRRWWSWLILWIHWAHGVRCFSITGYNEKDRYVAVLGTAKEIPFSRSGLFLLLWKKHDKVWQIAHKQTRKFL